VPVVYDKLKQADLVEPVVLRALSRIAPVAREANANSALTLSRCTSLGDLLGDDAKEQLGSITSDEFLPLFTLCAQVKDEAFLEEREWRTCDHTAIRAGKDIRYRVGSLGVTPFVAVPLAEPGNLVPITEIVIGPGLEPKLRIAAVRSILISKGYDIGNIEVRPSSVPYRPN
jgi:hypothetical protein